MKLTVKHLVFLGMAATSMLAPQVMSATMVNFNLAEASKPIDLSKANLLLEISRTEIVSREVKNHGDRLNTQAACDRKICDPSEEDDGELEARRFDERWWEDDSGDEWYEKTEYHKYKGDETWEEVGNITVKEGGAGFVSRPKG